MPQYLPVLINILENMNRDFGKGEITGIHFRMWECSEDQIYGQVERDGHDLRFFKLRDDHVVFLSRRRKFKLP